MTSKVVLIIQARMGSSRLPGKSNMDLFGEPLIGRMLERVLRCKRISEFVLAIPDTECDQILKVIANKYDVSVFSGSEHNVLERYYSAAKMHNADYVVRIPGDNPVPEPEEIDRIVSFHLGLGIRAFCSNLSEIYNSGYPDGIGAEIFDFSLLEEAIHKKTDEKMREHLHLNFFDYQSGIAKDKEWCPVFTLPCPLEFRRPDIVLDVNTLEQYKFMNELYTYNYPKNPSFHITDIIRWYDTVYKNRRSVLN